MTRNHFRINQAIRWFILPLVFYFNLAFGQGTCDFYGTAVYKGRNVTSGDDIRAYDPQNVMCGTPYVLVDGNYAIHVIGDDPTQPGDQGAIEGDAITFKINGEIANMTGNNIWTFNGSKTCNLNVPAQPPVANPGGPYSGAEGSAVNFNGSGSTNATTYSWNFGDGGTGSGATPSHTYADNGNYTVTLTVSNGEGGSDTKMTSANISNTAPTVGDVTSDQPKNEGSAVTFSGNHTDPAGANDAPYNYSWNFGDGQTGSGTNPTHTYANHGVYTVILSVTDHDGGTGTKQISVTINNVAPTANAGSDQTVSEGASVQFSGSATDPGIPGINGYGVKDVLTYSWDFGDGITGTGQSVNHTYPYNQNAQNQYTVTLTVSDGTDNDTDQLTVTINNVAPAANPGGPYSGIINTPVQFHGSATDPGPSDVLTYTWDLDNDGQFDDFTGQDPQKTFTANGTYTIWLKVTDAAGASDAKSTTVEVNVGIRVTFTTSPPNLEINFDYAMHTTPYTVYVAQGSSHYINTPWEQNNNNNTIKYSYSRWSDGGAKERSNLIISEAKDLIAYYNTQYWLEIDNGGLGGHPAGEGWHDPGSLADVSIDAAVLDQAGTSRNPFQEWIGTGNGSYSGQQRVMQVRMNEPLTQRAVWGPKQYLLRIDSPYGNPQGAGWYNQGASVSISVDASYSSGQFTRSNFVRWNGTGSIAYSGTANPAAVTMNGPVVEQVQWNTEHYLDLISEFGSPSGEGWYAEGTQVQVSIDTVVNVDADNRERFVQWIGPNTTSNPKFTLVINNPITETVQWKHQFRVQVVSDRGNPKGGGWFASGDVAAFSVDSVQSVATGMRYRFNKWQGTGTGSYTGTDRNRTLIVQGAVKEEALWKFQFFIAMAVDPADGGTITPIPVPGSWGNALDTLSLKAVGASEKGYSFSDWTGDTASTSNPLKLIVKKPRNLIAHFMKGNVLLNTNPPGLQLIVDGITVVSPAGYNWKAGEKHTVATSTPQGDNVSTRFNFDSWSDGGAMAHEITAPSTYVSLIAKFNAQFKLDIQSEFGTPVGSGWYASGASATIRVDTAVVQTDKIRQKFNGWVKSTPAGYTGSNNPATFKINDYVLERAEWKPQYKLSVTTFPPYAPGARIEITPATAWYNSGTAVQLKYVITDPQYSFQGWSGDVGGMANPVSVVMNGPKSIVANFKTPNMPPIISPRLPDTSMFEDAEMRLTFSWLAKYVKDGNDPLSMLTYNLEGALHFSLSLNVAAQLLIVKPAENWSGNEDVIVKVADPVGQTAKDTVRITVFPINDPPGKFSLISPNAGAEITAWNPADPLLFLWHRSIDPDPGDEVTYKLAISPLSTLDGPDAVYVFPIPDTLCLSTPPASMSGKYYWGVIARDKSGIQVQSNEVFNINLKTAVRQEESGQAPLIFELQQNFPNPFNPQTAIRYCLPEPAFVRFRIFDMNGRIIRTFSEGRKDAGQYQAVWDGRNESGQSAASGIYVLQIEAGKTIQQIRMLLVK